MLSDEFITDCRKRFDGDPSTRTLIDLLHDAYRAGAESALDADEWRVVGGHPDFPTLFQDEISSEEYLAIVLRDAHNRWRGETIWVEHRRVGAGPWERVADVA